MRRRGKRFLAGLKTFSREKRYGLDEAITILAGFPKAKFVAESVKQTAPGKYTATGPLTIKGTSQPVTAPFTLSDAAGVRTVEGQFTMKRLAFKIGEGPWSDTDTVADEVLVKFRFTLPK